MLSLGGRPRKARCLATRGRSPSLVSGLTGPSRGLWLSSPCSGLDMKSDEQPPPGKSRAPASHRRPVVDSSVLADYEWE
eukprot:15463033-Alexandrium_andersonii.AAC.1